MIEWILQVLLWCLHALGYVPPVCQPTPTEPTTPSWLVATSGICSSFNETLLPDGAVQISFIYEPRVYMRFTDYPYHIALSLDDVSNMTDDLANSGWDHRNVGLMFEAYSYHHDIAIYEITEHEARRGTVAWNGKLVQQTVDDLISVYGAFNCSLFVDSWRDNPCYGLSPKQCDKINQG